jgi:uncharacterized protein
MTTPITDTYRTDWANWRAGWEQWLAQPHNWLSAVAVNWLDNTPHRFDRTPGLWWQHGDQVMIDPDGTTLAFDGTEFTRTRALSLVDGPDDQRVTAGDLQIGITYRHGYHIITYDPNAPARTAFHGVPTNEPNPDWIISGRFQAFDADQSLALGTVGWREHDYLSPGVVHFEHDGHPYELQVIASAGRHTTVFADATSGDTTYPAGRALDIQVQADGTVTLDFNRAVNLPCAFGDFFPICPTPPAGNRYPFRIEAGEKTPAK